MKIRFIYILGILLLFCSCDKDEQENTCGENPLENISWLKELVDNENNTDDTSGLEIIQYTYKNNTVFSVNDCINCADAITVVYDCEKNVLCEFGGIAGVNTCSDFYDEAIKESILYDGKGEAIIGNEYCDKKVVISNDVYNEFNATEILNVEVDGNCISITHYICEGEDYIDFVNLVDSGNVMESLPVQRTLKFYNSLDYSPVFCQIVETTTSFDISDLATWDAPKVLLNIDGYTEQITYIRSPVCGDPNVSCVPVQEIEAKKLAYMLDEIRTIANSIACENADDWKITPIGSKACGGPQSYLAYSNKINEIDFLAKVEAYRVAEENYNKTWGIVSTCDLTAMPSSVICVNGKPEFVYNTIFDVK